MNLIYHTDFFRKQEINFSLSVMSWIFIYNDTGFRDLHDNLARIMIFIKIEQRRYGIRLCHYIFCLLYTSLHGIGEYRCRRIFGSGPLNQDSFCSTGCGSILLHYRLKADHHASGIRHISIGIFLRRAGKSIYHPIRIRFQSPVSYTHLDVYKRQCVTSSKPFCSYNVSLFLFPCPVRNMVPFCQACSQLRVDSS